MDKKYLIPAVIIAVIIVLIIILMLYSNAKKEDFHNPNIVPRPVISYYHNCFYILSHNQ